jgi:preprotein translocase subunit SecA
MQSLGLEKGEAIEHRMVSNAIEKAQRKVEGHNFDIRKNLLEYDDVSNDQRQVIYQQRNELMSVDDISDMVTGLREEVVDDVVAEYLPAQSIEEQWDIEGLEQALLTEFSSKQPLREWLDADDELHEETLREKIHVQIGDEYAAKEAAWTAQGVDMRVVEKQVMLQILDQRWKEHLSTMDHLRQGIHLRAYAQKQPKQEYKRESFELFQELLFAIKRDVVRLLSRVEIERQDSVEELERRRREEAVKRMQFQHQQAAALNGSPDPQASGPGPEAAKPETFVRQERKVGRNESCPCGSGKKYKHCHGRAA